MILTYLCIFYVMFFIVLFNKYQMYVKFNKSISCIMFDNFQSLQIIFHINFLLL